MKADDVSTKTNENHSITQVATGAARAFSWRALGFVFSFLASIVISRSLGAAGAGVYFTTISFSIILSVFIRLGFDNLVLRKTAVADRRAARGYLTSALMKSSIAGTLVSFVVLLFGAKIATIIFGDTANISEIHIATLVATGFGLLVLVSEGLRGRKRVSASIVMSSVSIPLVLFLVVTTMKPKEPTQVLLIYAVGTVLTLAVSLLLFAQFTKNPTPIQFSFRDSKLDPLRISWTLFGIAVIAAAQAWLDTIIVSIFRPDWEVGLYGVAVRISKTIPIILIAINAVVAPQFALLHSRGDTPGLRRLLRRACLISTAATIVAVTVALVFSHRILALFGPEFPAAQRALKILIIGQLFNGLTGPVGTLLLMTGLEHKLRNALIVIAIASTALALASVRSAGYEGVAIATSLGTISTGIIGMVIAVRSLRISSLGKP